MWVQIIRGNGKHLLVGKLFPIRPCLTIYRGRLRNVFNFDWLRFPVRRRKPHFGAAYFATHEQLITSRGIIHNPFYRWSNIIPCDEGYFNVWTWREYNAEAHANYHAGWGWGW